MTVRFETALPQAATLSVQLQPVSAGAALPMFMQDQELAAGTREVLVVVPYAEADDDVASMDYRISARADGDGVFLLGRSSKTLRLEEDGMRASVTLRAP